MKKTTIDYKKAIKYAVKIIDAWLPSKIQYDRIPALSVGLVHNGKIVYKRGFGFADVESLEPATPNTCYRIASISKTFTAVAIMQLAEQGKLHLDDKIHKYLPWFKSRSKDSDSNNITIRQILSHTAGVFRDGNTPHWADDKFPDITGLQKSISKAVVFENLTRFKYSNFGFALLGEVVKKISGVSYNEYVSENIIKKLGMERTAPDLTKENEGWLAKGYSRSIPNKEREAFHHIPTNAYASATGFLSNVSDLAKYLSALSLKNKNANQLINKESKKEIMREYWATGEDNESYGLGFTACKIENRKIVGHSGSFSGFITAIALDTENDIGVITLSNTNDSSAYQVNQGIFEAIYKLADEKDRYTEGKKILNQEKYEGIYRLRWGDYVVAGLDANLIAFGPITNSPIKDTTLLKPNGKNRFIMDSKSNFGSNGEYATFVFEKDKRKASKLIWGSTPYERLEE
ncbi:MAG: hypothetical protein A3C08_00500 [Candidatus Taylorbacteria bacterium RIFCSPHIGHO2_02_FULL_47_18]|uniref:Beta-lactamase-related domain-containing protein n=1 Tax=Candidatus Taylorbacteria bacterium RIFCSPLOWO2_01_FULL_48_100 TaxID=1802322 RepID=A0A1G2NFC8_9BACT|nr:MAG: hypothetical protein A2670_00215 [Candidatus Taylorbacteria bacterium RIFCSPHIGHO2_01_FULL_48_38]OHA27839.1 MAG: hypothetical protein A3C08_00500 [Candidatus Taylorbacteria bacterium RIFCSPHIGHO2_02_FULL_47_18]OHA34773.1 MAG: hypothetical protein A2938_03650 [Candidatus Taylorbacteria bacterium RIFCSPLOWO2_01_FULL_48_100]OHA40926.1 MAG: hypothetical protein A3J31_03945 [Candidatus Taylorbacteria bacterium RIFCSPLOWO2_02_FULL_48_16]OHA45064.1 MAG: hypothetical protein A3H13_02630 [Candid